MLVGKLITILHWNVMKHFTDNRGVTEKFDTLDNPNAQHKKDFMFRRGEAIFID